MKILHLISGGDQGGAKTHVITLLRELSKNADITLVCLLEQDFAIEARDQGINVIVMQQNKRYKLDIVKSLISMLEKDKYDILHCHGARANFIGMLIKKKYSIPTVSTIHSDYKFDFDNNLYKKLVYTTLNYFSLKHMDYFIAITNQFKQMLVGRGFKQDKIYVAYNGIKITPRNYSMSREEFLSRYNIKYSQDKIYVGIATRLHPVKGIPVFLKAAEKVLKTNNNIQFLIAGNGDANYTNKYKEYVKTNKLEDNVVFLNFVKDIDNFYNAIDINVLTSHSESFPYALLEGGLNKKATICSRVGGIPEMIINEQSGLLFEDGNYDKLAEYVERLAGDVELRLQYSNNLYNRIENNFSDKNMAKTHIEIYRSILTGNIKRGR
ncbi:glycosyl transferase [Vallitalea longa]|uniref:Glycosyl transferase n=1 Tax=Vallitalea longa TaxID=2936439 RepID=A0A9W5YAM3_9FIRM|nr:glycosyltransferase family 4 protein [Vallitalea longa]GKX30445.1 glycosyl transferase [Vallitalea longa]